MATLMRMRSARRVMPELRWAYFEADVWLAVNGISVYYIIKVSFLYMTRHMLLGKAEHRYDAFVSDKYDRDFHRAVVHTQ